MIYNKNGGILMLNAYYYDTSIGGIGLVENGKAIVYLSFGDIEIKDITIKETKLLNRAYIELEEYLKGIRKVFDLPLEPHGTEFQQKVWKALLEIPYGETRSYKDIAEKIGNSKASRAVGLANNRNPISIFIPCHRVIGANGKLVGYGGGLDIKERLLTLEAKGRYIE